MSSELYERMLDAEVLDTIGLNVSMLDVKPTSSVGDRVCDTCIKEDVCMYKEELAKAAKDIADISGRINVFIDTDIKCKKWSGKVSVNR